MDREIDRLDRLFSGNLFPFGRPLLPLPAHLVGVPAVVADQLEVLVGDVLGDGGDEVGRAEDLEVAIDLGIGFGAVDDGAARVGELGFLGLHWIHIVRIYIMY